jgi:hypothetical protein
MEASCVLAWRRSKVSMTYLNRNHSHSSFFGMELSFGYLYDDSVHIAVCGGEVTGVLELDVDLMFKTYVMVVVLNPDVS